MTLFDRVKTIAKQRGYSLAELARHAGIGEKSIYTWKPSKTYPNGIMPTHSSLKAVADVLGVSVDYLLGNTDDMHSATNADEPVDLDNNTTILSLDGMELSDEYKKFIVDQVRALRKMRGDS